MFFNIPILGLFGWISTINKRASKKINLKKKMLILTEDKHVLKYLHLLHSNILTEYVLVIPFRFPFCFELDVEH